VFWLAVILSHGFISFAGVELANNVELRARPSKAIYSQCANCHRKKDYALVPGKKQPLREHKNIKLAHGQKEMSCNHCHDKNNHNFLRSEGISKVSFQEPSRVCYQCHSDVYKSWENNIHGKRIGSWKGKKTQFHCTECHNPHLLPFQKMKAEPPPSRPKYGIPKERH